MLHLASLTAKRVDTIELVDCYESVEIPQHPDARLLLDYWRTCVATKDGFLVGRDIPARPIATILRSIALYEPLADGSDMKVRLAGQMVGRRFGGEIKGALMSQLFPREDFKHHLAASFEVVHMGLPLVLDSCVTLSGMEELHTETLLLPVLAPDRKSIWLLVGMFYFG